MRAGSSSKTHSVTWNAFQENSRRFYPSLLKMVWANVETDGCLDLAAQMSFYFVLSLFPFLLVVAAIIGWLPSTNLWHDFAQWITHYLPSESRNLVFGVILGLTHGYSSVLSFGLLGTIWAASSGVASLMGSLNVAHGVRETRSFWKRRAIAVTATCLAAIFFIASFGVLNLGHWAAAKLFLSLKWSHAYRTEFEIAKWLATLLVMCLGVDLINNLLPNIRGRWRWLTPGTLFVALTFVAASIGFNLYLRFFANYPRVYGALAGFVVLMIWIYMASLILLIGAETDNVVERLKENGGSA